MVDPDAQRLVDGRGVGPGLLDRPLSDDVVVLVEDLDDDALGVAGLGGGIGEVLPVELRLRVTGGAKPLLAVAAVPRREARGVAAARSVARLAAPTGSQGHSRSSPGTRGCGCAHRPAQVVHVVLEVLRLLGRGPRLPQDEAERVVQGLRAVDAQAPRGQGDAQVVIEEVEHLGRRGVEVAHDRIQVRLELRDLVAVQESAGLELVQVKREVVDPLFFLFERVREVVGRGAGGAGADERIVTRRGGGMTEQAEQRAGLPALRVRG